MKAYLNTSIIYAEPMLEYDFLYIESKGTVGKPTGGVNREGYRYFIPSGREGEKVSHCWESKEEFERTHRELGLREVKGFMEFNVTRGGTASEK